MKDEALRQLVRSILLERYDADLSTKRLLQKIDDGPYHMLPVDELESHELEAAEVLAMRGLVKRLPANRRFPERFVVEPTGNHVKGDFDMDTLHDERGRIYKARRQGTLKSQKW